MHEIAMFLSKRFVCVFNAADALPSVTCSFESTIQHSYRFSQRETPLF